MTQSALTDDRFEQERNLTSTTRDSTGETQTETTTDPAHTENSPDTESEPVSDELETPDPIPRCDLPPVAEHDSVTNVNIDGMELTTNADGWDEFPHPENIHAHLDSDMNADQSTFPDSVHAAIDELTDDPDLGEFLVFDAEDAYDYLETLQKQSDLYLENFYRRQLVVNQLSNGRGYAKGASLSTYDKKWICAWEVRRRLAERDFDEWGSKIRLSKKNSGLPNTDP